MTWFRFRSQMKGISWHPPQHQMDSYGPHDVGSSQFLMVTKRTHSFLLPRIFRTLTNQLPHQLAPHFLIASRCWNSTSMQLVLQLSKFLCMFSSNSWWFIAIFRSRSCSSESSVTDCPRQFSCFRLLRWCRKDQGEVSFLQISWVKKFNTSRISQTEECLLNWLRFTDGKMFWRVLMACYWQWEDFLSKLGRSISESEVKVYY